MDEISSHNWDFEAPSYMDFTTNTARLDDGADKFFDIKKAEIDESSLSDENKTFRLTFDVPPQREVIENKSESEEKEKDYQPEESTDKENVPEFANKTGFNLEKNIAKESFKPVLSKNENKTKAVPSRKSVKLKRSSSQNPITARQLRSRISEQTYDEVAIKTTKLGATTHILKHKRANSANFAIPNVLKRQPQTATQRHRGLTSEQREVEEIKELREKVKHDKQLAAESLKKINSAKPTPVAQTKKTVVKEFNFATDKRLKTHTMKTRQSDDGIKAKDFMKGLRNHTESARKRSLQPLLTQVQPFNLSATKKRKLDGPSHPPITQPPMAKMILDFQNATPSRFRTRSKNVKSEPLGPMKIPRNTNPVTPNLSSGLRKRPVIAISEIEKEEMELEEFKRNEFKALPIKANLFDGPEALKKIEKKPVTVPIGFNLHENKKLIAKKSDETPSVTFKANPCPSFEKITGVKEKARTSITVPESPAFELKKRIKAKTSEPETFEMKSYYKPAPAFGGIQSFSFNKVLPVKPVPFSFAERDREKQVKLQEKIKEIKENETKIKPFKANGMPICDSPMGLPPKVKAKATKPISPQFRTEERAANRVAEWTAQVDKDVSEIRKATLIKARPMPNPQTKWEPKKISSAPTETLDIQLASEKRAQDRREYETRKLNQIAQSEATQKEIDLENKKKEEREIFELRKKMVRKANPIPLVDEFVVTASSKMCTVPKSPKFSDRFTK